jgi:signal peptidase I
VSRIGARILRELIGVLLAAVLLGLTVRHFVAEPYRVPSGSMAPTLVAGDVVIVDKVAYGLRVPFTARRLLARRTPARGDVVVFASPREPGQVVRRVVGLPGDVVEIRSGTVWVNGVPQPRTAAGRLTYQERNESTGLWWSDTCLLFNETLSRGPLSPPAGASEADLQASLAAAAAQGATVHGTLQCRRDRPPAHEGPFLTVAPGGVFVLGDNRDRCADSRSDGGWQVPFEKITGRATLVVWSRGDSVRLDRLFKRIQ